MAIDLTDEQWAHVIQAGENPPRVTAPGQQAAFVLLPVDVYERFKAIFEEDPPSVQERHFQLRQFGKRAGWEDPEMNIYDDFGPHAKS